MTSAFACALLLAALVSSPAETVGVLAVAPAPGPTSELADMTEALRRELAQRLDGVLELGEVRQRMLGQPSIAALSRLDRAYEAAVDTLQIDCPAGMEQLEKIIAELERQPESGQVFDQWTRAMLRLARARLEYASSPQDARRTVVEAKNILERLVRAAPGVMIDPLLFSKRLDRLATEVKKQVEQSPTRTLVIRSSRSDTKVFIEGREVGSAPTTLKVHKGQYRVSGKSGTLRAERVVIPIADEDAAVALDFSLAEVMRPAPGPGLALASEGQADGTARAASALGLDRVVTTSVVREGDKSFLVASLLQVGPRASTLREGRLPLAAGAAPPGGLAELAAFLVSGKASAIVLSRADASRESVEVGAPSFSSSTAASLSQNSVLRSQSRSPVLSWSPVAAGALAVGMGAVATWQLVVSNQQLGKANRLVDKGSVGSIDQARSYSGFYDAGSSARRNALFSAVGAGASVIATSVLGYLAFKQTGEVGPFRF